MASINRSVEGEVLLEADGWILFRREPAQGSAWQRLKAVRLQGKRAAGRRRSFHLAHNGERFAETVDLAVLKSQEPALYQQIADCMQGGIGV